MPFALTARLRAPSSPFADVRPAVAIATAYAGAIVVWLLAGGALPGGRWFAVHLFTLGVVSNLVVALTRHFAQTLLHASIQDRPGLRLATLNAGTVAILGGLPSGQTWLVALGATLASAAVLWLYLVLRRLRRRALPSRFSFVTRTYERACGAFLHGAVLGALLGSGLLPGQWFAGVRLGHLHTNILGWGGLALLATLVMFGPTILRRRMQPGADVTAATWLRRGATGLTVAVLALIVTGAAEPVATAARSVAAAGLLVYSAAAFAVCRGVLAAARGAHPTAPALSISAVCCWLPVVAVADAGVVATAQWQWLSALGAVLLVGVLGQAVLASVGYLAPMLRAAGLGRERVRARVESAGWARVLLFNLGMLAIAGGLVADAAVVVRAGWAAVLVALATQVVLTAWPVSR